MKQEDRDLLMAKMEELQLRVGALASASKLIEGELIQLQFDFYRKSAKQEENK